MKASLTKAQEELINTSFIKKIDEAIVKTPIIPSYREPHLYPSSASVCTLDNKILGSCARKEFFRLCQVENIQIVKDVVLAHSMLTPEYDEASQQFIFMSGVMWEDAIVGLSRSANIFETHHTKWQIPKLHVSGELDIVLNGKDFGQTKPVIIEMKTTSGYYNETKIFKNGIPKDENLLQTALYCYKFRNETSGCKLVYYDRGAPSNRKEFTILFHIIEEKINGEPLKIGRISVDGELIQNWTVNGILQRFQYIWDSYINLDIPLQEFIPYYTEEQIKRFVASKKITRGTATKIKDLNNNITCGDFQCNYCKYRELCVALENNTIEKDIFLDQVAKYRKDVHNI